MSFANRIVLIFGAMLVAAVAGIFYLWYFGLPALGVAGAVAQRLDLAGRALDQTAVHQGYVLRTAMEDWRGDILVLADNPAWGQAVANTGTGPGSDLLHRFENLQRAYPGVFKRLRLVDAQNHTIRDSSRVQEIGQLLADAGILDRATRAAALEWMEESSEADSPTLVVVRPVGMPRGAQPGVNHAAYLMVVMDAVTVASKAVRSDDAYTSLTGRSVVLGSTGQLLSASASQSRTDPLLQGLTLATGGEHGLGVSQVGAGGKEMLVVSQHVSLGEGLQWTLLRYQAREEVLSEMHASVRVMMVVGAVLSAIAMLVIAMTARHLTRPLARLSRSATLLGRGDLAARAHFEASDSREMVELSQAFNTMAEGVAKSRSVLEASVQERTLELVQQRDTAQRYLDIARVMLIALDRNGRITLLNRKTEEVLGHPEQDLLGLDWIDNFLPQQERAAARHAFEALMAGASEGRERFENRIIPANGDVRVVAWSNTVLRNERGVPMGTLSSGEDITQRQLADERLQLAASVFTFAREGIIISDSSGVMIDVNDTFSRVTGYSREEAVGQKPSILQSGRHGPEFYQQMWNEMQERGHWSGEIWNRRKGGEVYAELLTMSVVRNAAGKAQNYVALFTDITPMKDHQRQLEHIAHYDALTSLPNRVLLADRLSQGLLQSQRRKNCLAVAFLDLDGFKSVNDHYGHEVGDHLLISLAQRMKTALREGDTLARIGGDEFVAVLVDLESASACEPILKRLLDAAAAAVTVDATVLQVSASIGVTLYPQDGSDADLLMRHADQAMYQAKQSGKDRYHLFDIAHDVASKSLQESLEQIQTALQREEFVLYYQPKVNLRSGAVVGAEALIRWQHPERGLLAPGLFLPTIEEHPVSIEVGEWVLATALAQMQHWSAQGLCLPVSVNIGAHQLQQANFAPRLSALLALHPELPRYSLELEILETSALEDMAQVSELMGACQALGVGFALDDFGTGYSSLTYLKRLPAQLLKIDQSFVRDMLTDADDLAIVQGVIGLAKAFGRRVIAEGVETTALAEALLPMGCELAQGYGIARPMPAAEIPAWVARWLTDHAESGESADLFLTGG